MSYRIEAAFRDLVLASEGVTEEIGQRMHANQAPQWDKAAEPETYATYFKVSSVPQHDLKAPTPVAETRMQLDVYARDYGTAQDIAEAIRHRCDCYAGTVSGAGGSLELQLVRLDDVRDQYEPDFTQERGWHRVSMDFLIWHAVTVAA